MKPSNDQTRAFAFGFAALILYVPANLLPILQHGSFGRRQEVTLLGGVNELLSEGEMVLAAIVLIASVAVPLLKICGVLWIAMPSATTPSVDASSLRAAHRSLSGLSGIPASHCLHPSCTLKNRRGPVISHAS